MSTLVVTALSAGLFMIYGARDLDAIDGMTIEDAEVVAVESSGPILFDGCGRSEGSRADVTWRSEDPPPGIR